MDIIVVQSAAESACSNELQTKQLHRCQFLLDLWFDESTCAA